MEESLKNDESLKKTGESFGSNWKEWLLNYSLYIILGVLVIGVVVAEPGFLSFSNLSKIMAQASTRGILALGVAGMIVYTGTDLGFMNLPYLVVYLILCSIVMWVIWNKTTLGRNMFAIGGWPKSKSGSGSWIKEKRRRGPKVCAITSMNA